MAGTKRYAGKMALMQYEKLMKHDSLDEYGGETAEFVMGDAQIDTQFGTFTTQIVEIDHEHFTADKDGCMCVSDDIDVGVYGAPVYIRINAPLRYWTLINRD